jgi:hypothetical protein
MLTVNESDSGAVYVASNCVVTSEYWFGMDVQGTSRDLIRRVPRHFSGRTEEGRESQSSCWGLNPETARYEAGGVLTWQSLEDTILVITFVTYVEVIRASSSCHMMEWL